MIDMYKINLRERVSTFNGVAPNSHKERLILRGRRLKVEWSPMW
jgi:hypothetical protein